MRFLLVLLLLTASACASTSSMDELIANANSTGNWTAVNQRLDAEEESLAITQSCRDGDVLWCDLVLSEKNCHCVRMDHVLQPSRENEHRRGFNRRQ